SNALLTEPCRPRRAASRSLSKLPVCGTRSICRPVPASDNAEAPAQPVVNGRHKAADTALFICGPVCPVKSIKRLLSDPTLIHSTLIM
ncbi:hypothetical protein J6590_003470, partial [Homalodisca vitripennis]